jgi:hypothetical protein
MKRMSLKITSDNMGNKRKKKKEPIILIYINLYLRHIYAI